jgi:four helix bundle protein
MSLLDDKNTSYRKLKVYQKSKELVLLIYKITKHYPKEEIYVLVPQMRRSSISVMANIVEGYVKSKNEFVRFINICIGSASELEIYLELSFNLEYLSEHQFKKAYNLLLEVKKLLYAYKKSLRSS